MRDGATNRLVVDIATNVFFSRIGDFTDEAHVTVSVCVCV